MRMSIKIGKIYGVPVRLHFTLIFIVALIAWSVGSNVLLIAEMLGITAPEVERGLQSYLLGLVIAIGLFVSVLIHEMAHSIVSIKNDLNVEEISLWLFGGVSKMEEIPKDPNLEIKISAVGPLSSLGIGFLTLVGGLIAVNDTLRFTLLYLSFINFFLAAFNLIPAFPMDGGRILRALLAKRYSYLKATTTAASVGKIFAVLFAIGGFFYNIFLVLIAFFIYMGASQESKSAVVDQILENVSVREVMSKDVKTIEADSSIKKFLEMVTTHRHTGFPVTRNDKIVGIISLKDAKKVPLEETTNTWVKDVMKKEFITLEPNEDAATAWKKMLREGLGRFPVIENGNLAGIVTRSDIDRTFNVQSELQDHRTN
ncbi:MAG: CBS domain-containing protein [Candidatus Natronoplasma sp.]